MTRTWEEIAHYVLDRLSKHKLTPYQAERWLTQLMESVEYEESRGRRG